jgi:signal peptidase II
MIIILYLAIIAAVPAIALFLNSYTQTFTKAGDVELIPGLFKLTYSENRGVAFGLFQNSTVFFAITTSIVILAFIIILFKNYNKSKLLSIACALIIGGGAANLYERVANGFVYDYLSLSFFPPICNFADYCITAGTVCLIVYLLFFSDFLKDNKKVKTDE